MAFAALTLIALDPGLRRGERRVGYTVNIPLTPAKAGVQS